MKKFFCLSFLLFFLDHRSTNLLRLFSGNLPAMFSSFGLNFFLSGFPNPFIVRSRSIFLINENSWNCTSGLVLLCFLIRRLHR